ncbi:MAG: extracellular solute-binding protein [Clostridiales bacterium]|nr:extracellular solute-binding protein [Clostridiales bacterium]
MKKTIRSALALILTASFALSSAACNSKNNKKTKKKVVSEDDAYFEAVEKEVKLNYDDSKEISESNLYNYQILGDTIAVSYYLSYKMPKDVEKKMEKLDFEKEAEYNEWMKLYNQYYENGTVFFNMNLEETGRIRANEQESLSRMFEGPNGEILALVTSYTKVKTQDNLSLCEFSPKGEKIKETKLDGSADFIWDGRVSVMNDGKYVSTTYDGVTVFDPNGKEIGEIKIEGFSGNVYQQDGKNYVYSQIWNADYTNCTTKLYELDIDNLKISNPVEADSYIAMSVIPEKNGNYIFDANSVKKVDLLGKKDPETIIDWNETDILHSDLNQQGIHVVSENEICLLREEIVDAKTKSGTQTKIYFTKLTRAAKNPNAGKQIIELGCNYMPDLRIQKYIIDYNKDPNRKSRIVIHDYSGEMAQQYLKAPEKTTENYYNTLYLDMLSHSGPDILLDFADCSQFNNEKVLVDLNTFIDGASGLQRDQYFDNIFRAFETNGKLFQIPLTFSVDGFLANKDVIGDRDGWTYDEFDSVFANLPDKMTVFELYADKLTLLRDMLSKSLDEFVDFDQKKVSFNSESFKKLMEICKKYGNESMPDDPIVFESSKPIGMGVDGIDEGKFDNDMIALEQISLGSFESYMFNSIRRKGKVSFIGVPSDVKKGLSADATSSFAIAAGSEYKEDAWDFIRFLFEEEMQTEMANSYYGFPIYRKALRSMAQNEIKTYNEDKARFKEHPEEFYDVDGNDPYPLDMTEKDIDGFEKFLEQVTRSSGEDEVILNIIAEEMPAFFSGQRSAEDVSNIIQNKVNTIVNER